MISLRKHNVIIIKDKVHQLFLEFQTGHSLRRGIHVGVAGMPVGRAGLRRAEHGRRGRVFGRRSGFGFGRNPAPHIHFMIRVGACGGCGCS